MTAKLSTYLQTQFGSTQKGLEFLQFSGWLLCLGITLPVMSSVLVSPVVALVVGLLFVLGVVWLRIIWGKGLAIVASPIDAGMAAILFAVVLTTYFSIDPSRGMRIVWHWSALILLFYILLVLFRLGFSFYPPIKALLIITSVFVFFGYLDLFIWLFNWYAEHGWPLVFPPPLRRVYGLFGSPNSFGGVLAMMLALGVAVFVEFKQYRSAWWVIWLVTTAGMLVATQSRGAWVSLLAAFSIYGLSKAWIRNARRAISFKLWMYIFFAIIGGVIILVILLLVMRPTTFAVDTPLLVRWELWQIAFDNWLRRPWLGSGPNTYPTLQMEVSTTYVHRHHRGAHNFFLNTLAEMGLAGIAATLLLVVQLLWLLWRRRGLWNRWTFIFLAPLVVTFVHMQSDLTWLQTMVMASIFLAGLVASLSPYSKNTNVPSWRSSILIPWCFVWMFLVISGVVGWKMVKQYENGIIKIAHNDWEGASHAFYAGQGLTPYTDSLFLYASGFSNGVLAVNNDSYLPLAIENQERLLALEPGWSVHYANLAGLYRQADRTDEAVIAMQQAIKLTPDIPLYYLNLGLWYEEEGKSEMAVLAYRQLYQLPYTWHDSPFWSTTIAAQAVDNNYKGDVSRGYNALATGRVDDALDIFHNAVMQRQTPDNYLGLGIAQLYAGEWGKASESFERTATYPAGMKRDIVELWQTTVPFTSGQSMPATVAKLQQYYSVNESNLFVGKYTFYTRVVFEQVPIPYELLPQLSCFSHPPTVGLHMRLLEEWYVSQNDVRNADYIEGVLLGEGDGLTSCTPLVDMPNEGVR